MRVVMLLGLMVSLLGCVRSHDLSVETQDEAEAGKMSAVAMGGDEDADSEAPSESEGSDNSDAPDDDKGDTSGEKFGSLRAEIEAASDGKQAIAKMFAIDDECEVQSIRSGTTGAPKDLRCTGLYADVETQELGERVFEYEPASPLWSDGSAKQRFIYMPEGAKIDATDPAQWRFPEGVKLFKDFRTTDGRLVETRMFFKNPDGRWSHATYQWDEENTEAQIHLGGDVEGRELAGFTYSIPTSTQCNKCHDGNSEHVLGFDAVALGLPLLDGGERRGLDLKQLVEMDMISPAPPATELEIGDDGTGLAAPALAFLHTNCGTSCHNDSVNARGGKTKMYLNLDPEKLDGRSPLDFDSYTTTIGVLGTTPAAAGMFRLLPGEVEESLILRLMRIRGDKGAMPPLGTNVVDEMHLEQVENWVKALSTVNLNPLE